MGRINRLLGLKNLRQQMRFWISTMIILLTLLITTSFMFIGLNHTRRTTLDNMEETLEVQNIYVEKWFEERAANIRSLANMNSTRSYNRELIQYNLNFLLGDAKEFDTIHFIDRTGHIVVSTVENPTITDMSDRVYFHEAMEGREYITDVLLGRGTHRFIIVFSSPVFDFEKNVIGTVIGSVNLGSIDKIIEDIEVTQGKDIYIVNKDGYMITESRFLEEIVAKGRVEETARMNIKGDSELFQSALSNGTQKTAYKDYRGESVFGTYRWTNDGKWIIISEIDKKELQRGLYTQFYSILTSLAFILALTLFITMKLTKKIEEPIKHLLDGTSVVQGGNYEHKINDEILAEAPKELKILCEAFNEMASTIRWHMETIQESEEKYKALLSYNPDLVYSLDAAGKIKEINTACTRLLGYEIEDVIGQSVIPLVEKKDLNKATYHFKQAFEGKASDFEVSIIGKNKNVVEFNVSNFPIIIKEEVVGIYGIAKDITEKKELEHKIRRMAYYDALTNLPNRYMLDEYIHNAIFYSKKTQTTFAILFMDLDRFKLINDTRGHVVGDKLLIQVSNRLLQCVRKDDIVSRQGGDEFIILLKDIERTEIEKIAERILTMCATPFMVDGEDIYISSSIGISLYPDNGQDMDTLTKNADTAMYLAKERGRNNYQYYIHEKEDIIEKQI